MTADGQEAGPAVPGGGVRVMVPPHAAAGTGSVTGTPAAHPIERAKD